MDSYLIVAAFVLPVCVTMFAYRNKRKRDFVTINSRETLSYSLQHEDEFYSVKRSKSALKKSDEKSNYRKSVQFNEVVLEVFDLINDDELEEVNFKPSCPKIVKSPLKNEKVYVPVRYSNTIFPKTIINENNGEIINLQNDEDKQERSTSSNEEDIPEILIINEKKISKSLSNNNEDINDKEITSLSSKKNEADKVITSEANNIINSNNVPIKSNTFPRRSRPVHKGHRRTASVRLKCIY
jgi:hypothetical protein